MYLRNLGHKSCPCVLRGKNEILVFLVSKSLILKGHGYTHPRMEKLTKPILIKFNRRLSWALAIFSFAPIATGYAQTVFGIDLEMMTRIHIALAIVFSFLLIPPCFFRIKTRFNS